MGGGGGRGPSRLAWALLSKVFSSCGGLCSCLSGMVERSNCSSETREDPAGSVGIQMLIETLSTVGPPSLGIQSQLSQSLGSGIPNPSLRSTTPQGSLF